MTLTDDPRTADHAAQDDETRAALPLPGDRRFTYRHLWDALGWPVQVTHIDSGVTAVVPGVKDFREVTPGKAIAAVTGRAVDVLDDRASSLTQRALAILALRNLDAIGAWCVCGGLLHYGAGGVWRHVNVCEDCLSDPTLCATTLDQRRHRGCAQPQPVQCEHNCRRASTYDATAACGSDRRCCGGHDCDTALTALNADDRRFFVPAQPAPVAELQVTS